MAETTHTPANTDRTIRVFRAIIMLVVIGVLGYFVYTTTVNPESRYPFKLGLDLAGGSHLVYEADVSDVDNPAEIPELMNVLRDVIERRINVFGVSEPIVQVERSSIVAENRSERLVVELPGVTDVEQAVREIGKTPLLEFKLVTETTATETEPKDPLAIEATVAGVPATTSSGTQIAYQDTGLTGRYLERAELVFGQGAQGGLSNEPTVSIVFDEAGGALFEEITRANVGEQLAIFLDGEMMSAPVINEAISGGRAVISGNFTPEEARELVRNLNFGALPVAINLVSTQTVGASLGSDILNKGVYAGFIGLAIVLLFMVFWYRLPGFVAGLGLIFYALSVLTLFKLIPVTITAAGLAGFILSLGMAVDANVLVFERMKEEFRSGKSSREAAQIGFARAWSAIRDSNVTSLFSAIILFWFGTSLIKGFALVFGIGVLMSMISAISVTRTLLMALPEAYAADRTLLARLFGTGLQK